MKSLSAGACAVLGLLFSASPGAAETGPQLRTQSDLGFPEEGYCVDVLGIGDTARADLPLIAHNCLPEAHASDRFVEVLSDGRLYMPAFESCVTAFAVGEGLLPGAPVVLRPCGAEESFLPADRFQRFERTEEGHMRLADTELCLAAGPDAAPTFNPTHRWRTLTMETCATLDPELGLWRAAG
ncbi:RICIN domain-containing protein [Roseobacter weihaiensis]|uniref:RICIN domain-containing protein n=1 Tax=Roseobacter weihaiensis TaxID=2763262 RepID=UPI001D0BA0B5|nr:RICIN domain-containing protein [Roseobacter sp. H9]